MRRRCIHERISAAFADATADGDFEAAEGWLRVLELASETRRCAALRRCRILCRCRLVAHAQVTSERDLSSNPGREDR
jgi:hypothetical protein